MPGLCNKERCICKHIVTAISHKQMRIYTCNKEPVWGNDEDDQCRAELSQRHVLSVFAKLQFGEKHSSSVMPAALFMFYIRFMKYVRYMFV